ncbi:hypothetical protein TCAL_14202 [Tigriopus californicus]|uniref:Uncharacterized protein n=2 Tax=Tigriopus californicus TaxID=6832 RepID=A0A553NSP0_TIGCA|nr:hypothetical protein TCAL_14202 [Tigriopus californicus]
MTPGFFPSARKWRRPLNLSLAFVMLTAVTVSAAPFSSWAGKRSTSPQFPFPSARRPDLAQMMHELQELYTSEYGDDSSLHQEEEYLPMSKRAPFSSWAGKRAPFSSWAGKRAAFSSWAGKRAPFSSWAGKRSGGTGLGDRVIEDDDSEEVSNNRRFKRSSEEELSLGSAGEPQVRSRRGANSFSAWGGKRAQLQRFTRDVHNDAMVPVRVMRPHRAAFSAWGG